MVRVAPGQRPVAVREAAAAVAHRQGPALGGRDHPGGPAQVQQLAAGAAKSGWQQRDRRPQSTGQPAAAIAVVVVVAGDGAGEGGVARQPSAGLGRERPHPAALPAARGNLQSVETAPAPRTAARDVHNLVGGGPRGRPAGYGPGMAAARPSTDERQELGRLGEALAGDRLQAAGLRVVARNWRCREGEIDLVAAGPGLLVFCEVKTRRGSGYGSPAAAVTPAKQARLRRLAAAYLAAIPTPPCRVRFDVVAVTWPQGSVSGLDLSTHNDPHGRPHRGGWSPERQPNGTRSPSGGARSHHEQRST